LPIVFRHSVSPRNGKKLVDGFADGLSETLLIHIDATDKIIVLGDGKVSHNLGFTVRCTAA
jgi:hypothetical protein